MEPQLAPLIRYRVRQSRSAERLVVEPVSLEEARLRWWMPNAGGSSRERWARVPQRIVGTEPVPVSFAIGPWWDRFARTLQPDDTLQVTWSTERLPADAQPLATGIERAVHLTIPFAGESTLARAMAAHTAASLVVLDGINHERGLGLAGSTISAYNWQRTYAEAYQRIAKHLAGGRSVIFDHANLTRAERDQVRAIGQRAGAHVQFLYVAGRRPWFDNGGGRTARPASGMTSPTKCSNSPCALFRHRTANRMC